MIDMWVLFSPRDLRARGLTFLTALWRRIRLLGALSDAEHHVKVPRFCAFPTLSRNPPSLGSDVLELAADDAVRSIDAAEQKLYASLSSLTGRTASNLKKRFSEPSFSVGNVRPSSGSGGQSRASTPFCTV